MSHAADETPAPQPPGRAHPRLPRAVQTLIAICVAVYFLQLTLVSTPDMIALLGFRTGELSRTWWTAVTYMFVHAGFWHLALNMYSLFLFGPRVEREWSGGEFARFFVMCGLGGLLLVVAADDTARLDVIARAAITLGIPTSCIDDGIRERFLVERGDQIVRGVGIVGLDPRGEGERVEVVEVGEVAGCFEMRLSVEQPRLAAAPALDPRGRRQVSRHRRPLLCLLTLPLQ